MIASVWLRKHPKQCWVSLLQRLLRRKEWGRMAARTARWRTSVSLIFQNVWNSWLFSLSGTFMYILWLFFVVLFFKLICALAFIFSKIETVLRLDIVSCCSWLKSYYFLRNLLAMDLVVNVEKKWLLPCFLFTFSCTEPWLYDSLLYKRVDLDSHTLK